jgi:hypothetical protein
MTLVSPVYEYQLLDEELFSLAIQKWMDTQLWYKTAKKKRPVPQQMIQSASGFARRASSLPRSVSSAAM